jgi:16S rRNA (cytosine967-C5)-methyltransferase
MTTRHELLHYSGKPLKALDSLVARILVLGLQQIRGMSQVPPAIAVDQAVEQCRRGGRGKSAGLVNAVLRNVGRMPPPEVDPTSPEQVHSIPRDLYRRWEVDFGPRRAHELALHANSTPPLILRLEPGVTTELLGLPAGALRPHDQSGMWVAEGLRQADIEALADRGLAQPQDPTAALVISMCDLKPGLRVLDRCCGSGTKTVQLWHGVAPGRVDAVDISEARIERLRETCARRGITGIETHVSTVPEGEYDRLLLDVPCSNSGTLARRPEARYHQQDAALASLRKVQEELLGESAARVKPGGLLIYSTCSIDQRENELRVRAFLARDRRYVLQAERLTLPAGARELPDLPMNATSYRDGGYVAAMVRAE